MKRIELSIVIPTFNEEVSLATALASIARQKQIEMEIIVADGDSTDLTSAVLQACPLRKLFLNSAVRNRAEQLNAGAALAKGEYLLFLHADSSFPDEYALRKGVDALRAAASSGNRSYAGHFRLKFGRLATAPSLGFAYYERKASLNRAGCAHGDQGIVLPTELFAAAGPFSTGCPLLAETRFADRLREQGVWLLLPADILTSARRFEAEGLQERQTLNAVIMALGAVGQEQLINGMPNIYREQSRSEYLDIYPLLKLIGQEITVLSRQERRIFWLRIGAYARDNAWQIPFFLDVRREFRTGDVAGDNGWSWLDRYERFCRILPGNRPGAYCAGLVARFWFKSQLFRAGGRGSS